MEIQQTFKDYEARKIFDFIYTHYKELDWEVSETAYKTYIYVNHIQVKFCLYRYINDGKNLLVIEIGNRDIYDYENEFIPQCTEMVKNLSKTRDAINLKDIYQELKKTDI